MKLSLISGLLLTSILSSAALGWSDAARDDSTSYALVRRGLGPVDRNDKAAHDVHELVPRDPRRGGRRGGSHRGRATRGSAKRSHARDRKKATEKKHQLDGSHRRERKYITNGAQDSENDQFDYDEQWRPDRSTTNWQRSRLARRPAEAEDFENDPMEGLSTENVNKLVSRSLRSASKSRSQDRKEHPRTWVKPRVNHYRLGRKWWEFGGRRRKGEKT